MRIAREDESLDAEICIFPQPIGYDFGSADECGARAAGHEGNSRPKVGRDLQITKLPAAMKGIHSSLAFGLSATKHSLGSGDCVSVEISYEIVGGRPGLGVGFAHDNVQANSKVDSPAPRLRPSAKRRQLRGNVGQRLGSRVCRYVRRQSAWRPPTSHP